MPAALWGVRRKGTKVTLSFATFRLRDVAVSMCGDMDLPRTSACGNCHNPRSMLTVEHTPTQTAGYSDEQLIEIFSEGKKPAGGTFNSPFLRAAPMPDCIFEEFHTWEMTDEEKIGIVWKLRSLPPKVQEEIAR